MLTAQDKQYWKYYQEYSKQVLVNNDIKTIIQYSGYKPIDEEAFTFSSDKEKVAALKEMIEKFVIRVLKLKLAEAQGVAMGLTHQIAAMEDYIK